MSLELVIAIGGWIFSVFTARMAYKAATKSYKETTKDSDKDIFIASVTNERAKWREELRKAVTEYMKQCVMPSADAPELLRLKAAIILRLNPRARDPALAAKHLHDSQIIDAVNALFIKCSAGPVVNTDPDLMQLELSAQELLKQEWEKSKEEARTGHERSRNKNPT